MLAAPLSNTKNSTSKFLFSNEAKIGQVSPFDKQTPDKTSVLNFRPIFMLYTSKKIGKVMKNYLMKSMDSAHRPPYSTQHVLLRLIDEWKTNLDNNFVVGAVLEDLFKVYIDCVPYELLIAQLAPY